MQTGECKTTGAGMQGQLRSPNPLRPSNSRHFPNPNPLGSKTRFHFPDLNPLGSKSRFCFRNPNALRSGNSRCLPKPKALDSKSRFCLPDRNASGLRLWRQRRGRCLARLRWHIRQERLKQLLGQSSRRSGIVRRSVGDHLQPSNWRSLSGPHALVLLVAASMRSRPGHRQRRHLGQWHRHDQAAERGGHVVCFSYTPRHGLVARAVRDAPWHGADCPRRRWLT